LGGSARRRHVEVAHQQERPDTMGAAMPQDGISQGLASIYRKELVLKRSFRLLDAGLIPDAHGLPSAVGLVGGR
jgi:hypothetical protein